MAGLYFIISTARRNTALTANAGKGPKQWASWMWWNTHRNFHP